MAYNENNLSKLNALLRVARHAKAAEDAAANALTGVSVNGTALSVANKIVNLLIAAGSSNGTIRVNNVDVAVTGLAALAYKSEVSESDLAAALKAVIDGTASGLETLVGSDAGKSARTIANEELAARLIPAGAKEALDTLQEIAAWIQSHPDEASAINAKLTLGTHEVGGEQVQYSTVKDYVEAMISGLITLSALSAETTGAGNAVTALAYDSATGKFTATKGETFVLASQIATDAEATEALDAIFGAET